MQWRREGEQITAKQSRTQESAQLWGAGYIFLMNPKRKIAIVVEVQQSNVMYTNADLALMIRFWRRIHNKCLDGDNLALVDENGKLPWNTQSVTVGYPTLCWIKYEPTRLSFKSHLQLFYHKITGLKSFWLHWLVIRWMTFSLGVPYTCFSIM